MQKSLLYLFLFSVPFTSAFAVHRWVHAYTLVVLVYAVLVWGLHGFPNKLKIEGPDWLLITAVCMGFIGFLFAPSFGGRSLNHSLAILTCVGLLYFFVRDAMLSNLTFKTIVQVISISLFLHSLFILFEFFMANMVHVSLRNWIPYIELSQKELATTLDSSEESTMLGLWIRPQGVAIEAGHMAVFFEVGLPMCFLYLREKSLGMILLFAVVCIPAFALLSSAGAASSLFIGTILLFLLGPISLGRKFAAIFALCVGFTILYNWEPTALYMDELIVNKTMNFLGLSANDVASSVDRSSRIRIAQSVVAMYPAGIGWGTSAEMSVSQQALNGINLPFGYISLYAEFAVAGGYLALGLFIAFVGMKMFQLYRMRTPEAQVLLLICLSVLLHYSTVSNYWFPAFWLPFVLTSLLKAEYGTSPTLIT